ncbi:MAG TPA: NADH:ubiquinone oxidoreductase [Desulfobacteria bacterium]|nr:NADH:ubiquinone oxidoreductase [Desulfobacteria bacterium]
MSRTLYWIQGGGCGGDTWSFLNAESPDLAELLGILSIEVLWHPSLSALDSQSKEQLDRRILKDEIPLDILCLEGSVIQGPSGTGLADTVLGKPKKEFIGAMAEKANHVIAVGTCASFGGFGADKEAESTGLQFHKHHYGGFLGKHYTSKSGLPVINLPGCPCHSDVLAGTLSALANDMPLDLDKRHSPLDWYRIMVHQGCTRNEYHEYRVEEKQFGEKGCLFFYMGCQGPLVTGPCNKILWNRRSSKTRVGVPCFGCTHTDFPQAYPFFKTRNIEGIPIELPAGVSRAHYMAYKGMAAAAAPKRLIKRKSGI